LRRCSTAEKGTSLIMDVTQELVMVPTRAIKPYHRNPRKNDVTVDKLVELIPKTGFNVPLLLDRQNIIVKGHTRWRAAIRLGMTEIPCVYSDADEETNKFDRLADNRVQEYSAWDDEYLQMEVSLLAPSFGADLAMLDFSVPLPEPPEALPEPAGSPPDHLNGEPAPALPGDGGVHATTPPSPEPAPGDEPDPPTEAAYLEVVCNHCGTRLRVKRG